MNLYKTAINFVSNLLLMFSSLLVVYFWLLVLFLTYLCSFPCGLAGKESTCNVGNLGSIPGLERSPGEGNGYPLQYSGLENSMDCIVHEVAKSQTQLSDFHFHFWASLISQLVKNPPAMQETPVRSLGQEDPLEKG